MNAPNLIPFPAPDSASDNEDKVGDIVPDDSGNLTALLTALIKAVAPAAPLQSPAPRTYLVDACNRFLVAKAGRGCRPRYLVQLRSSLSQFAGRFGHCELSAILPADIRAYLANPKWADKTRLNYWIDLKNFFTFCAKDGLVSRNPVAMVDRPLVERGVPAIHRVGDVAAFLRVARELDPPLANYFARAYFLGLRPSENDRLQPDDIGRDHVIVSALSKSRKRRPVPIPDNLRAWLRETEFSVPLRNFRKRWAHLKQQAGVAWSHDVARHTYCSCALALHGSRLAARWAGHSEEVLFSHYAEIVSEVDARAFFAIFP